MSSITKPLLQLDLFKPQHHSLPQNERVALAYHRARKIGRAYGLTKNDILSLSPKFWALHRDLINPYDMAAFTLLTIQYNLAAGTLAPFVADRPDLELVLQKILGFEVSAQFLLTEVGHGLDARNLETTATALPGGGFELHTPHKGAAKYMPPTSPQPGFPRVAIVIARLTVDGQDRGLCPFLVWLNDGYKMHKGVSIKLLPRRTGSKPLDHCITTFNRVQLPPGALLGSLKNSPIDFHKTIHRIHVGTLALTTTLIPILKRAVYITAKYSLRRNIKLFTDESIAYSVRHGMAATFKAVLTQSTQASLFSLSERGISIAEGDTLVLCIRLATELLIGRYTLPPATDPSCPLAQYENGLYTLCRNALASLHGSHCDERYNALILPHALPLIEAIGHRMAYEAARAAGIDSDLLEIYEAGVLFHAPAWYVCKMELEVGRVFERENRAMESVLGRFAGMMEALEKEVGEYVTAPILGEREWEGFVSTFQGFEADKGIREEAGDGTADFVRSVL
ncbi:acyl-CoA dehydrogenase/oxidase [Aspergillus heterothallicus]